MMIPKGAMAQYQVEFVNEKDKTALNIFCGHSSFETLRKEVGLELVEPKQRSIESQLAFEAKNNKALKATEERVIVYTSQRDARTSSIQRLQNVSGIGDS